MAGWVDFSAVKGAVSLEAVLRHYQVPDLRRRRNQVEGSCPIHRGKRDDSFRASLSKNVFHCFACQAHGNVLDLVAAMEKVLHSGGGLQTAAVVWHRGVRRAGGPRSGGRGEAGTGSGKRRAQSSTAFRTDRGGSRASLLAADAASITPPPPSLVWGSMAGRV
jgi:hypothetical protein